MNYIKNNINKIAIILLVILTSCEYDSTNTDPTRPGGENVPLVAIVPAMQTQTHRNIGAVLGRYSGILTQQWKGVDAQQLSYTEYFITEDDTSNPWDTGLYTGSMRDAVDIIERASAQENFNTRGLAKMYLAINLGIATNVWGNVPYSEAFLAAENLSPKYDDQEELYTVILDLLDEAINDLEANDPVGIQGDLIDATPNQWIATAHALKARFYMQLSSRSSTAAQDALDEISQAFGSNEGQLDFIFENSQNGGHPLALFGFQRPNTMVIGDFFADLMTGDPRQPLYMVQNDSGNFVYFDSEEPGLVWSQLGSSSPVISYAEVKFIEAEATERNGGNAQPIMEDAIRVNMEYLGVSTLDIDSYISTLSYNGIETIIVEKYKAMYGQSPLQVWNDYRRTGFPALTPNPDGVNGNNSSGIIPRRLLYPITERQSNPDSYQEAIQAQGGHLLDDEIWVFPTQ
jgi:hypothetical protein